MTLGLLLVSEPLAFSSARVASETLTEFQVAEIARTWESGSEYEVRRIDAQDEEVRVLNTGEEAATNFSADFCGPGQGPAPCSARPGG